MRAWRTNQTTSTYVGMETTRAATGIVTQPVAQIVALCRTSLRSVLQYMVKAPVLKRTWVCQVIDRNRYKDVADLAKVRPSPGVCSLPDAASSPTTAQIYANTRSIEARTQVIAEDVTQVASTVDSGFATASKQRSDMHQHVAQSLSGIWDTGTKVYTAQVPLLHAVHAIMHTARVRTE